ncbi:MAG: imidazolonepropionase [Acidobacteria bacterium]|nr:imidazolonepropionase [Acidobacteriota bacterium]MCI0665071.1 imidazolonepropionase [Acidobacteriota bacterium]
MSRDLAVLNCSQLITLSGPDRPRAGAEMRKLAIISDGAMLIGDGRIERIGTRAEIEPLLADYEVVDAGGRIVLPGFIDAHTHPVFAGNRIDEFEMRASGATYQEIAAAGGGIRSTVKRTRAATEDELVETGKRYSQWFLRTGTTTVEAKSGYGLTLEDELKILRTIRRLNNETPLHYVPTFLGAHVVPDEFKGNRSGYVDLIIEEMLPRVVSEGLAEYCDVFCDEGAFSIEESRRILAAAKNLGLGLRVHADQLTLCGGADLAAELGASTADHLEQTGPAEISNLKSAGVQPVLLPASVLMLGSQRYPDARAMIEAGLAAVVATDFNPGSSPVPSMLMVLSLASTQMKMTPAEALTAATINAAYSLGRGNEIGSLETGKRADFVIHDCSDYRELAYFTGIEHPFEVYVNGQKEML